MTQGTNATWCARRRSHDAKSCEPGSWDPFVAVVDRRHFVYVDGHQLHRPADAIDSCAIPQAGLSLDKYGLREHRDCVSRGLFDRADGVRKADRSRRDAARTDDQRDVVFAGVIADFAGKWAGKFRGIPISAWIGRVGKLAGGEQSGFGMVSEARTRIGGGVLRQRVVGGRRGRAVHYFADLFALGLARGICDSGAAGIFVADCLAQDVLPAAGASADYGCGATDADDRHREGVDRCGTGRNASTAAMGRLTQAAADVGDADFEGADRSGLVFCDGLVSDFSRGEGNCAEERVGGGVDSVSGCRSGEFFWRLGFGRFGQARMVGGGCAEVDGGVWWIWRDAADSYDFYREAVVDHIVVCDRDVRLRCVFDDCECVADGFV